MERPEERIEEHPEEHCSDLPTGKPVVAIGATLARQGETDHHREEDAHVAEDGDGEPSSNHEAHGPCEALFRGRKRPLQGVRGLPRLREARGKHVHELALFADPEVPSVLVSEVGEAALGVAQGKATLGRGVGHGLTKDFGGFVRFEEGGLGVGHGSFER
jgi:hypothetical protein